MKILPFVTLQELQAVYAIEHSEYGPAFIADFSTVQSWWQRYPCGILALEHNGLIIGALGLWPLTEAAFSTLSSGQMGEKDIAAHHIVSPVGEEKLAWWYVADIILRPQYRGGRMVAVLLREALSKWFREAPLGDPLHCVALAYSAQGQSLLEKLGLREETVSPDAHPVYVCVASPEKMERQWMRLFEMPSRRQ